MRANTYEKPHVKYVSLQNEAKIADTCWGYHGTDTILYFDKPGYPGYNSFQIAAGSCKEELINVYYHYRDESGNKCQRYIEVGSPEYVELLRNIAATGANVGQPFKGAGVIFDDDNQVSY